MIRHTAGYFPGIEDVVVDNHAVLIQREEVEGMNHAGGEKRCRQQDGFYHISFHKRHSI
jgi:hypothetical protein